MSSKLQLALDAAEHGAKHALKYFNSEVVVSYKEDNTPVTIADNETEQVIRGHILEHFPNSKFVGEEGGGSLNQDSFWILDPIDGTRHFTRGIPSWRVLIGYIEHGVPILGVSYSPFNTGTVWAESGEGCYVDGLPSSVSKINKLSEALLCYGNPKYFEHNEKLFTLISKSASARSFDTGYGQALVAMGKVEASVDGYGKAWDVAPYIPIIQEAGGKITNLKGNSWDFGDKGCIATNGLLHEEVVKILNT